MEDIENDEKNAMAFLLVLVMVLTGTEFTMPVALGAQRSM